MPELPEVETIVRDLQKKITGKCFSRIEIRDSRVIRNCSQNQFVRRLRNTKVRRVSRTGKAVVIHLSPAGYLTVQPMMSGKLIFSSELIRIEPPNSTKIVFHLTPSGFLQYNDVRMFGRVNFLKDLNGLPFFNTLGPDPLDSEFNTGWIGQQFQKRKAPVKSVLMDQHFVAGIGNIYASEILFLSGIAPSRPACSLTKTEIRKLREVTVGLLTEAIRRRGTSMRTYRDANNRKGGFVNRLKVYDRADEDCVRCRAPIERIVQAGRSTFFCGQCQG